MKGDTTARRVPSKIQGEGSGFRYRGMEGIEAGSVAKATASGYIGSPGIARRSCSYGRWSSGVDARVDLGHKKIPEHVREKRKKERGRLEVRRGYVVAGVCR